MYQQDAYRYGCHRSFLTSQREPQMQKKLRRGGIIPNMPQKAFARLPKLRTINFTDLRFLARQCESYSTCCNRLFGNTLQPRHSSEGRECWNSLMVLLNAMALSPHARIDSFLIAGSPFEYPIAEIDAKEQSVERTLTDDYRAEMMQYAAFMPVDEEEDRGNERRWKQVKWWLQPRH